MATRDVILGGTVVGTVRRLLLVAVVGVAVTGVRAQYRNDRNHETLRDDYWENHYRSRGFYSTPPPIRTQYSSGDTYYGTDRRYDTRYDDPSQTRGFDNRYQDQSFRYSENPRLSGNYLGRGRYDARGRERPGSSRGEEPWDYRQGILDIWRPDLQGEFRPAEEPGLTLPLADIFVTTDSGKVQGFYVYLYDKPGVRHNERPVNKPIHQQRYIMNVSTFLGIPYAKPPLLEGRFKPPRHVPNWYSTWQALDFQSACPQNLKYIGASNGIRNGIHEDCLYLNVFTPSVSINVNNMYPVLFYIHGGNLDHGASNVFPGHMLAAYGEVVVVTFNYRLGALGFLSTGDANSPGNYGLMDMAMALEWVYTNIRFFNGDRNKITVFGPGAGGAMAGVLAVLPRTKDYVSQVIVQSGSPLAEWAVLDDVYRVQNTSRVYGLEVGCTVENSYKLLQCLNRRSYEELSTAPITPDVGTFAWAPVVDTNFTVPGDEWYEEWKEKDWRIVPEMPLNFYQRNHHHPNLRYMAGVNRDAAANFVFNDNRLVRNRHEVTEEFFNERVKDWVKHYNYSLNMEGAYDAIKWMYTYGPDPHNTTHIREQYVHMLSDALYKSGVDQIVKVLVNSTNKQKVPTYYYLLNTTVEALKLPFWREIPNDIEYYFISGAPFMDPDFYPESMRVSREQWSEGDRNISEFMMKTIANFAKWGNPTQTQVEVLKVKWEEVLEGNLRYLSINTTFNTSMHYNYRQPYNTFWTTYMPQVIREWVPTVPPPLNPWTQMSQPIVASFYGSLMVCVVLLVILFVCCGLWKSAKRQRNKALDDLQYISSDHLEAEHDQDDYKVREYLDRLSNHQFSNGQTSSRPITPTSRPITPNTVTTEAPELSEAGTLKRGNSNHESYRPNHHTMAKSVDQLNYPRYQSHNNHNNQPTQVHLSRSTDNILKSYPQPYITSDMGPQLNGHVHQPQPQQRKTTTSNNNNVDMTPPQQMRPITPASEIHSEPLRRPSYDSAFSTQPLVCDELKKAPSTPVPTVRTSVATITSTTGLLHTEL